ncbi:MAG UNVERIFIED_CONTAM: hypothetical protein LVR18_28220 [Planctomycetaceae bacterium]
MSIPRYQLSKRAAGRASHSGAGTHLCVPSRTRAVTGRYRPIDIDRSPEHLCPESTQLRFRPVRPAQSAWHEMPGDASPGRRRPAYRRRCKCKPGHVDHVQPDDALLG